MKVNERGMREMWKRDVVVALSVVLIGVVTQSCIAKSAAIQDKNVNHKNHYYLSTFGVKYIYDMHFDTVQMSVKQANQIAKSWKLRTKSELTKGEKKRLDELDVKLK